MTAAPARPPRMGAIAWRLAIASVVIGLVVALALALIGTGAAGEGVALFVELVPAILMNGIGMAVPPFLFGMLGVAAAQRPPRRLVRELVALGIGAAIGVLMAPLIFYVTSVSFGLVVAGVLALLMLPTFLIVVARLWRGVGETPSVT